MDKAFKFTELQIESILDRLVPAIAAPADHEFFRGVLRIYADASTSGEFALFVKKMLDSVTAS